MGMVDQRERILSYLDVNEDVDTLVLAEEWNEGHQKIVGSVKSLQSHEGLIEVKQTSSSKLELTNEGKTVAESGSHEALIFNSIPEDGMTQAEIMKNVPNAKIGFNKAMSAGWITINKKAEGGPKVFKKVEKITDSVQETLQQLQNGTITKLPDGQYKDFKKRKLLTEVKLTSYVLNKGQNFSLKIPEPEKDLTDEMLVTGSWKNKEFKSYNFDALGIMPQSGHLHPLLKVRAQYKEIFLEMGFSEMPTNNFVESSFWNFDALFQPQQHPARDAHDTFFISEPQFASEFPEDYLERVKKVHAEGGYGSQGYKYDWKIEEARKNIMRTHTTAVSARMLYKLAQQKPFKPVRYFSIDRVFRNETLDATHLAEFHQIEGVIADYDLTLGDLMGVIHEFFKKLEVNKVSCEELGRAMNNLVKHAELVIEEEGGIQKIKFKPAYNPYTEPSMEIFSYHEGLKKWVEIGNSGVFRPEMLLPMGLPEGVSVIAWGLSLERPTMILYGINNIRDLIGPKVKLPMIYNNPICRIGQ